MGTWGTSMCGNDTAQDLYIEYSSAFFKYDVEEALKRIDNYIRTEMFDESDEEEWCNYYYSLADFMWKKGILTETVKSKVIGMIDSGFGLEIWAESGKKMLEARKKKLQEFKEKLLSPMPAKKKIKPNVHTSRIFEDGDIIAVQLQTESKPYTADKKREFSEEEFHLLHGKYVLMQLIDCNASWTSRIVPEVKDYWAHFRLFDGIYDTIPENIDFSSLKDAHFREMSKKFCYSNFICESSMFYFKKRNYKVICNRKDLLEGYNYDKLHYDMIIWGMNKPWGNPDSDIVAAMGKDFSYKEWSEISERHKTIIHLANCYGRYNYELSRKENDAVFEREENHIFRDINSALEAGGKLYSISFRKELGIITVANGEIDNLYISGQHQKNGYGTQLLEYALSVAGEAAYIEVPASHKVLIRICEKLGLKASKKTENSIIYTEQK